MNDTLLRDLENALAYFKARVKAMRADEYLAAVDTIIALKDECKSNAAFSKVLEEEGFTEEILPRNERSCITGWFADLSPEQRNRVIEWMNEREQNGDTFRLQTAERHFAKMFNDEDEEEDQPVKKARVQQDEEEEPSNMVEKLQKSLDDLRAKYVELEQKLASMAAKDSKLMQENKSLKAKIKELEEKIVELSFTAAAG